MTNKPIPLTPGHGSIWTGWTEPLEDKMDQLLAEVEGLKMRLRNPAKPGVPAAYQARRVFTPETASFALDTAQDGVSSNLVNYVVRDGATYDIPIVFPGPGVFVCDKIRVAITQRLFSSQYKAPVQIPVVTSQQPWTGTVSWTTKFSLFPVQPMTAIGAGDDTHQSPSMNYVWNIIDQRSGRRLASDFLSHMMLLPRTHIPYDSQAAEFFTIGSLTDGDILQFDAPWVFERDGQCNFQFRPITPVLQFDSTIAGNAAAMGLTFDDRENSKRNQSVTVAVEMHGFRYETDQDALRMGALTR